MYNALLDKGIKLKYQNQMHKYIVFDSNIF